MEQNLLIARETFKQRLIQLINESQLPAFVIADILERAEVDMQAQHEMQLNMALQNLKEQSISKEFEQASDQNSAEAENGTKEDAAEATKE